MKITVGKSYAGSRWIKAAVERHDAKRLIISAPTFSDIKRTILFGESGLMNAYPDDHPNKPNYLVSHGVVEWPKTKSTAILVPAESPDRARGHSSSWAFLDELSSFGPNGQEFFESLQLGMRLYPSQTLIATTPKPNALTIDLFNRRDKDVRLVTGSTFDNAANLDERMLRRAKELANTALGKQEIYAELALSNPAALFSPELIEKCLRSENDFPRREWVKCVIGIDPSASRKNSDLTGIVIAVQHSSGLVLILEDLTGSYSQDSWVRVVAEAYDHYSEFCPTVAVVERNGVGDTWKMIMGKARPDIPMKDFSTTKNKFSRIGQTAFMVETEKVFMNKDKDLSDLQNEAISWTGGSKEKSPDRLDAMSFAVNEILYKKQGLTISREMLF